VARFGRSRAAGSPKDLPNTANGKTQRFKLRQ